MMCKNAPPTYDRLQINVSIFFFFFNVSDFLYDSNTWSEKTVLVNILIKFLWQEQILHSISLWQFEKKKNENTEKRIKPG